LKTRRLSFFLFSKLYPIEGPAPPPPPQTEMKNSAKTIYRSKAPPRAYFPTFLREMDRNNPEMFIYFSLILSVVISQIIIGIFTYSCVLIGIMMLPAYGTVHCYLPTVRSLTLYPAGITTLLRQSSWRNT
jgi:hypothetical protein